ncbi:hypothetical protein CEUSTIGMA_g2866.t1 [Chlamydomonas eustigma]|uniref:B9 domain-containing protein 2 n=1 Tax=Chlamydomonas eustigma TaxID=1157962 RepID=A0A250WXS5_9CHLO|nr:hypothetical protein CEUSTIGMA_g2866.t1 [Chlamydomonas eustigma]|eukprot:GAX75422.1 hypothetical protein CEUSTIGMA_g2866.t1 [Chlamydomonas eustigma]
MAEMHVLGQLLGGSGFQSNNIFCKWGISTGRTWELLEGLEEGQTQLSDAADGEMSIWAHPIDAHYACKGLTGWPKLYFQVWTQDIHGRNDICGYGFCHIPTAPGSYQIDCPTWIPEGSAWQRFSSFFIGGNPRLKVEEVIHTPGDRFRLHTTSTGTVHLDISLLMKDFERNHVHMG